MVELPLEPLVESVMEDPRGFRPQMLAHGLERVLATPGVHPRREGEKECFHASLSRVPPPGQVFEGAFVPTSQDERLHELACNEGRLLKASTSSMSPLLSHMYWGLSNFRRPDLSELSEYFQTQTWNFTQLSMRPTSVFLRPRDGTMSVDTDRGNRTPGNKVLMELGKVMEAWLTLEPELFGALHSGAADPSNAPVDAFRYLRIGDAVIRSQLDAYSPILESPELGGDSPFFELKTRATAAIRLDVENYEMRRHYVIDRLRGQWWSYEREFYDMARSTLLRYLFQMRVGHMGGMLVAYHNTDEVFGFEFMRRTDLERVMFGSPEAANTMFHAANRLLQLVVRRAVDRYGANSPLRMVVHASRLRNMVDIFIEKPHESDLPADGPSEYLSSEPATERSEVSWWRLHLLKFEAGHPASVALTAHPDEELRVFYRFIEMSDLVGIDAVREAYAQAQAQSMIFSD